MARSRIPHPVARALAPALALAIAAGAAGADPLRFTGDYRWFDAGLVGEDLATSDFNGDGLPDLAVTHPFDHAVSVLLSDGLGGFHGRVGYAAGASPEAVTVFDADGDGRTDLVIANPASGTLSILYGRRDGTFEPRRVIAVAPGVGAALGEDLDGDGLLDLACAAGTGRGSIVVLRGLGDRAFGPAATVHDGVGPMRLAAVGAPGGRRAALAAVAGDGRVTVLAAHPGGGFRPLESIELGGVPSALVPVDLDHDGIGDLAVALVAGPGDGEIEPGRVRVLRGSASGRFRPAFDLDDDFVASSLAAADVDGDGWTDLTAMDRRGGALGLYRNDRAGGLERGARLRTRVGPGNFAAGDWDCDGRRDLVALGPRGFGIVLLPGNGDGSYGDATDLITDFGPAALWLGDLDGDGVGDLVATDRFTSRLAVMRGDGAGSFAPPGEANTYGTHFAPRRVQGATLRPGGPVDLVVAHGLHGGFLSVGRNDGTGGFAFAPDDTVHTGGLPFAFALGDVDGDGAIDAVVANDVTNTVAVLLGDGAGRFRLGATLDAGLAPPVALALGDLDHDGRLDLVIANEESHRISTWRGAPGGALVRGQEILAGLRPLSVTLADTNGDGHLDLVTGQAGTFPEGGMLVVYRGDGAGGFETFNPGRTADVGFDPVRLFVGDLDQAGPLDVAVANGGSSTVSVLPGLIARPDSFGAPVTVGTGAGAEALVGGDLDRDGRTDLVFAGKLSDRIGILLNRTGDARPGVPGVTLDLLPGACPNVLAPGEGDVLRVALAGDGVLDLADVLPQSARLEGIPPRRTGLVLVDESGPADACGDRCACDGRAPDGIPDAIFEFDAAAIAARLDPALRGETQRLRFTARLRGGRTIEAHDCLVWPAAAAITGSIRGAAPSAGLTGANPLVAGSRLAWAYEVPAGGADVRIGVYSVAGRRVARLAGGFAPAGRHHATWSGRDDSNLPVAPGVYFLRAQVGVTRSVARIVLVP